jgi:hypothetical protein
VLAMLGPAAERDAVAPEKLLERLRGNDSLERVRADVANSQAIELLVREANPITVDQAQAREKLWTPGKEGSQQRSGQLWTPGS